MTYANVTSTILLISQLSQTLCLWKVAYNVRL